MVYRIDERFRQLTEGESLETRQFPKRDEFKDPLLISFQSVALSSLIDEELDRFYNPSGPVEMITRVFRRFRRRV